MKFTVKEDGKNGTIEAAANGLTRTTKKLVGRDNTTFINYSRIDHVTHISKMVGSDIAEVSVGGTVYAWKCANAAELVDLINGNMT